MIAKYNTNSDGRQALAGHYAIDPQGGLMLLPPDRKELKPGWRWATADEVAGPAPSPGWDDSKQPPYPAVGNEKAIADWQKKHGKK